MSVIEVDTIQQPKKTEAQWAAQNPVLKDGEQVFVVINNVIKSKVGDGVTAFNALSYLAGDNEVPVQNASETVKGISEEATLAELTAGTGVGATGARLYVNPGKLVSWWNTIKAALTKNDVGLGNVNNTTDANKPVSIAQAAAILVVQNDINAHEARVDNPHAVTKAQVGLGSVDNTTDVNKPVSTAQAAADATVLASANSYTDTKVAELVDSSPATLNTLNELANALGDDPNFAATLATQIGAKEASVNKSTDVETDKLSNVKFPSVKSVYDWAVGLFQTLANKDASGGYVGLTLFKINFKNVANTFTSFLTNSNTASRTYTFPDKDITVAGIADIPFETGYSLGAVDADATTGTKETFLSPPYPINLTASSLIWFMSVAPTGSAAAFDLKVAGVSIFSTKPTIDAGEFNTLTANTPYALSTTVIPANSVCTLIIDQVGATIAGKGPKFYCYATK